MNEHLKKSLHVLFHTNSPEQVLKKSLDHLGPYYKAILNQPLNENFVADMNKSYNELTGNEVMNILQEVQELADQRHGKLADLGVFAPLIEFAKQTLELHNGTPVVKYERLLAYREVSLDIGSDIVICAFLAYDDFVHERTRSRFDFPTALPTNNTRLQNMLKAGLAENHFHLKGSAQAGILSWIYLMNNVTGQSSNFKKLHLEKKALNSLIPYSDANPFRRWVFYAAAIRQFLFKQLKFPNAIKRKPKLPYLYGDQVDSDVMADLFSPELQDDINILKVLTENSHSEWASLDYAIINTGIYEDTAFMAFFGERDFLYSMFYAILNDDSRIREYIDLFYFYLLVHAKLYGELIQSNEKSGFDNFSKYQERKDCFFDNNKKYKDAQIKIAFASILSSNEYRVESLEARFIPRSTKSQIAQQISDFDKQAAIVEDIRSHRERTIVNQVLNDFVSEDSRSAQEFNHNYFYVAHFSKSADELKENISWNIYCRHNKLRKYIEKSTLAIAQLRNSGKLEAYRLFGIDACSNEIGCRPEVFAQAFRYLKAHHVEYKKFVQKQHEMPPIRITYHVGEDFLDMADGLRAVDEAIYFLGISHGDRIGHGTVLGSDADYWYKKRNCSTFLSRQDLLDNCAWMLLKLSESSCSNIPAFAEIYDTFRTQYNYVYLKNISEKNWSIDYNDYMDSWKLRGDNPYIYQNIEQPQSDCSFIANGSYFCEPRFGIYAKNKPYDENLTEIRNHSEIARYLYYEYHFNPNVRKSGSEIFEYHITPAYISAIKIVQKYMREYISRLDIGIECNPSSNVKIGGLKRYDRHPILTFNNCGLGDESKESQMFVSINTDDQGVFDTSLENEYALIACALNREVDDDNQPRYTPTQIYKYLDKIRKMGIEQSFNYQNKE